MSSCKKWKEPPTFLSRGNRKSCALQVDLYCYAHTEIHRLLLSDPFVSKLVEDRMG